MKLGVGCGRRLGRKSGRQELLAPGHGQQGALALLTVTARLQGQAQPQLRACSFCHLTDTTAQHAHVLQLPHPSGCWFCLTYRMASPRKT